MYRQTHFDLGSGLVIAVALVLAVLLLWALLNLPMGAVPALTGTI